MITFYELNAAPPQINKIAVDHDKKECRFIVSIPEASFDNKQLPEIVRHFRAISHEFTANKLLKQSNNGRVEYRYTINSKSELSCSFLLLMQSLIEINNACCDDVNTLIDSISNIEAEHFEQGNRTILHAQINHYRSGDLKYAGNSYKICTGPINFASSSTTKIASVGTNREIILLDTQNPQLQALYREFEHQVSIQAADSSPEALFNQALKFSNAKITNTDFDPSLAPKETVNIGGMNQQLAIYPLERITEIQTGVCRHHAFFIGFLLGEYVKRHKIRIGTLSIHHCRDSWVDAIQGRVAHTWIVCKKGADLYLVDGMWNKQHKLTDYNDYTNACTAYTQEVIDRTLKRAKLSLPIPRNLSPQLPASPPPVLSINEQLIEELNKRAKANVDTIASLISEGAPVNTQGESGWSAAHVAALANNSSLMDVLIEKGAHLNLTSKTLGQTPLFYTSNKAIAQLLVKHGANLLIQNKDVPSKTALQVLLKRQVLVNSELFQHEIKLLSKANSDLLLALLAHDPNGATIIDEHSGWSAAHIAVNQDHEELLTKLIASGCHLDQVSWSRQYTALCYVKSLKMLRLLLDNQVDYLHTVKDGRPAYQVVLENSGLDGPTVKALFLAKELEKINSDPQVLRDLGMPAKENTAPELLMEDVIILPFYNNPLPGPQAPSPIEIVDEAPPIEAIDCIPEPKIDYPKPQFFKSPKIEVEKVKNELSPAVTPSRKLTDMQTPVPSTEEVNQLKVLHELERFITTQIKRLSHVNNLQKGIEDKTSLYLLLKHDIQTAIKTGYLTDHLVENFIKQTAIISHHRRYRTSNQIVAILTFGLYTVEANSWKAYQNLVKSSENWALLPSLKYALNNSLRINDDNMHCTIHPKNVDIDVEGYEEYRKNMLGR